jgi:hypothetical protein
VKLTRTTRLALTAVAAAAAPLALMLPAQASTSSSQCTLTPQAPVVDHYNSTGQKVIKYANTVTCQSGRTIEIQDQRWDDDSVDFMWSPDDYYGQTNYNVTFNGTTTVDKSVNQTLPDADAWGDNTEEMYHYVRFRVSSNGVTSPWTNWEYSPTVSFHL